MFRCFCVPVVMLFWILVPVTGTAGVADFEKAAKNGQIIFAVVFEPGNDGLDKARSLSSSAASKTGNATVVEINRTLPESADFLFKYRANFAPVPLVMVFSESGMLAGVAPAEGRTVEDLVRLVPSPKKSEVLKAIQSKRSVFITAAREGMAGSEELNRRCIEACGRLQGKAVCVGIDLKDEKESSFLSQLGVNPGTAEPVTVVVNSSGQVTGLYTGLVETAILAGSAGSAGGGCCPGGNKSCGAK